MLQPVPPQLVRGRVPFVVARVHAGFPSPADDYIESELNLHDLAVRNPASTFFLECRGASMAGELASGDILVVDRALTPGQGDVVVAIIDGEFTVKRFFRAEGQIQLVADNPAFAPIIIAPEMDFAVWGVVTFALHPCRKRSSH